MVVPALDNQMVPFVKDSVKIIVVVFALARVKPKDKDSGDVERFRLRQVTNRDGRAVALDRLTLRLQTLPRREGYWLDTGMLKTG